MDSGEPPPWRTPKAARHPALRRERANCRANRAGYFCQVRFLWRFARSCLRRLCLLIFALRRFLIEPIVFLFANSNPDCASNRLIYDFVQWIFDDAFRARRFQLRNQLADHVFIDDGFHGHPALLAEAGNGGIAQ